MDTADIIIIIITDITEASIDKRELKRKCEARMMFKDICS